MAALALIHKCPYTATIRAKTCAEGERFSWAMTGEPRTEAKSAAGSAPVEGLVGLVVEGLVGLVVEGASQVVKDHKHSQA
jgi:hypothetical protein